MQAVILAAGNSSRFTPFNTNHKSLQTVMGMSIIGHTIESIRKTSVNEIIIVCKNPEEFKSELGEHEQNGVTIRYCVQSEALGMGDALLQAKEFINSDFFVLSAHRIDFSDYYSTMIDKKSEGASAVLVAKKTDNVSQYGAASLQGDKVTSIIEKPEDAGTELGYRLLSTYLLPVSFLEELENTPKEHYQFEKALSSLCAKSEVKAITVTDETFSLKYAWDLLDIKNILLSKMQVTRGENVVIADTAQVDDTVIIGNNVKIMEYAVIKGPGYIGDNSIVGDFVLLRNGVVMEKDTVVGAKSEVKNSIIQEGAHMHDAYVGDSVIGKDCRLGAMFCTANARVDRKEVSVVIKGEKVASNKKSLGVFMGDKVHTGIQASTMPGVIIGCNAVVGPTTVVMENMEDNTILYTEQSYTKKQKKTD